MKITELDIEEFQLLCRREFGVELSPEEAATELRALLTLVRILLGIE